MQVDVAVIDEYIVGQKVILAHPAVRGHGDGTCRGCSDGSRMSHGISILEATALPQNLVKSGKDCRAVFWSATTVRTLPGLARGEVVGDI